MKGILLGLKDYENHMTDEGHQLQMGLIENGFEAWGSGFDNNCTDVATILEKSNPDIAVVIDKREWDASRHYAFDKLSGFTGIERLANRDDICRITILKDAGTGLEYAKQWAKTLNPHGYIVYYHPDAVARHSHWASPHEMIRTYHSIDARRVPEPRQIRGKALVSGARNPDIYRLRETCFFYAEGLGLTVRNHPGYSNKGSHVPQFLDLLNNFRVHVCCASRFGFALRKIIESVACGCVPITDLPAWDILPEIDDALVRVETNIAPKMLREVIDREVDAWDFDRAMYWAERAKKWYDYRVMGKRLADNINTFAASRMDLAA